MGYVLQMGKITHIKERIIITLILIDISVCTLQTSSIGSHSSVWTEGNTALTRSALGDGMQGLT